MSLFKQLLLAICLFLVVAFSGSFMVSLESSRSQYVNQLRSHAQDAATALALSLTPNIDDPAMVELMVSSIFDSGYYASIKVVDLGSNAVLVERHAEPDPGGVPLWFVRLIGLEAAGGDAIVSRGWQQAARVEVISHPMFAIAKLWQSALGSLGWLLLCGAASAVLGALLLRRQLRPLDYMVEQSHAIARREFLSLPELPRTPELRRVVQAMNQMVEKLKALFTEQAERSERLRAESYQDSLTGLSNRRYFEMQLNNRVSNLEDARAGYLLLLRVQGLAGLNARLGGQRTDQLLQAVGEQLRRTCASYPETNDLISRSRGGEFAVLAPGMRNDGGFLLWWDGLRSEMQPIHDSQGVFAVLEKEVRRLGFDYYAYGVRHTIPFTRPKTEVHGTYPKAWLERYQMQNYGAVDPAILNGLRSSEMVVWSDSLFDQSRMLWNEARDWGLCVGATLPIRAPNNLLSVLSVARDQQNISSFEREEIRLRLRCMIELLTQKLTDLEHPMLMSNPVCLSHREREILQWTADGKSSGEIAIILSISESTVNFHHKNIQKKFDAPNKTLAATYAAALGLI